jgi:hypothetical protein
LATTGNLTVSGTDSASALTLSRNMGDFAALQVTYTPLRTDIGITNANVTVILSRASPAGVNVTVMIPIRIWLAPRISVPTVLAVTEGVQSAPFAVAMSLDGA